MEFSILGPLEVRRDGRELPVGAPKLRALLTLLVLDAGRVVTAERLVDDLWTDEPPPQPMVSLRSYISNLRRLLQAPDGPSVIQTRARGYVLDVPPDAVDAVRFERLAHEVRTALEGGRAPDAVASADAALDLWRGPALADVADEAFAHAPVVKLDELRMTVMEDRVDGLLSMGRHVEIVPDLEAHVGRHPLRERPHRQLMLALYRSGRSPDALAVHRRFRASLADELGLDPSPVIDALADDILRQAPSLDVVIPPTPPKVAVAAARVPPVPTVSPLVGRDAERARIASSVARLSDGVGSVLLVAGDPGIGKTALLDELSRIGAHGDIPVVWGRCQEAQGAPPLWPWLEALRALATELDDESLVAAVQGSAGPVTQLVPEIAERTGRHYQATGDPDTARFALYDAVVTFLQRVAAPRGLVIVIDDLHWGDPSALQLVGLLGGRAGAGRIVLAGAYRNAPSERTPELDATLATLARVPAVSAFVLGPLGRDDGAAVIEAVTGDAPGRSLVDELYGRAGGNPFFIRQLAQLMAESGDATAHIPTGVRHVILRRAQLLPPAVRRTLEVASSIGSQFDLRVVASAAGPDVATVLDHLDTAVEHRLVAAVDDAARSYRFVHPLIRETLYDELAVGTALRFHAAAAQALEQHSPGAVGAIAEHLWLAAELVAPDRPVAYLRAAAEEALAVFAHDEAERQLRRALHLLDHHPAEDPDTELAVRLRLIQVLTSLEGWTAPAIEDVAGRVRELAGRTGIGPGLMSLWWSLWTVYMTRGELDTSEDLARQLLTAGADDGDPALLVAGHTAVAYTRLFHGAPIDELTGHVEAARDAATAAGVDRLDATAEHLAVSLRVAMAMPRALVGDANGALTAAAEGVAVAQQLDRPFSEAYAALFGGWAAAATNCPEEARAFGDRGLSVCERGGFGYLAELITPTHAWACARTGEDLPGQLERIARAIAFIAAAGHRHALPQWWILRAEMHLMAADEDAADRAFAAAARIVEETGEDVYGSQVDRIRHQHAPVGG